MRESLENAELLAFTRTVEAKSMSRAAAELGVPRATLSRRLARLERTLGVRLLRRTTRNLSLTEAGEALYRHARIVLDAVAEAEASVRNATDLARGDLRVSVPTMSAPEFLEVVEEFVEAHPDIRLQLLFTNRTVDLQREGYDVALRATADLEPGLVVRTLVRSSLIAVASPSYLAKHGKPSKLQELRNHRCLTGFARGELPQVFWKAVGRSVRVDSVFSSNNSTLLCRLAARGQGIAFVPALVAAPFLARKQVAVVMPGILRAEGQIAIVYREREFLPPQVRRFVDWMIAHAPKALGVEKSAKRT